MDRAALYLTIYIMRGFSGPLSVDIPLIPTPESSSKSKIAKSLVPHVEAALSATNNCRHFGARTLH
jgi:hypothetical protein